MSTATYDQIEIEDMTFHPDSQLFTYPCPCGDRFEILIDDMVDGEDIAICPSCSLMIDVIFEPEDLIEYFEQAGMKPPAELAVAA
ncbi:diphthamide biosynthesis protein 3 [Monosporozyma servazzii]